MQLELLQQYFWKPGRQDNVLKLRAVIDPLLILWQSFAWAGSITFAGQACRGRKPPGGKRERDTPPGHVTGGRAGSSGIYLLRLLPDPLAKCPRAKPPASGANKLKIAKFPDAA